MYYFKHKLINQAKGHLQMSKQITNQDQKGFTIIEVLIVLAIAALILLVVFLAIPGLQRSQRNSARKADIGKIVTGVSNFTGNNNGTAVLKQADCTASYLDVAGAAGVNMSQFKFSACNKPTTTIMADTGVAAGSGLGLTTTAASINILTKSGDDATTITSFTPAAVPTANVIVEVPGNVCNSTYNGSVSSGSSSTSVAIVYTQEGGNGWSWNCVNAG